jgi:hypothetical protein
VNLEHRNKRLGLNRASLRADLLKERSLGIGIKFHHLMQADFVLFIRAELETEDSWRSWWPETLVYLGRFHSSFEIFARATSKNYFDRVKCLLAINTPEDIEELLSNYKEDKRSLPKWGFTLLDPKALLGYDQLAKRP